MRSSIRYYSTNLQTEPVSLRDAVLSGLAPDGGLYLPEHIPPLSAAFFTNLPDLTFPELSLAIARHMLLPDIPEKILADIVHTAMNFPVPLRQVRDNIHVLELFHGPTLAFKDFAARFMAGLMGYFVRHADRELTILVATSGDTGGAVAHGFLNTPGIRVIILYPSGKVSEIQEKQLTTLGENITALEIQGTFDDCQHLVKTAFMDPDLQNTLWLTSANSINIARLIPQAFYYFHAWARLNQPNIPLAFAIPSGNFGNLTGGLLARKMGLPIQKFIAAVNANDVFPTYLDSGSYTPKPAIATLSNAMDVGNPSNFVRVHTLLDGDIKTIRELIFSASFSDRQTREQIRRVFAETGYVLDPHGAVGMLGLESWLDRQHHPVNGIFLETAHPVKFKAAVEAKIGQTLPVPVELRPVLKRQKKSILLDNSFDKFREWLLSGV